MSSIISGTSGFIPALAKIPLPLDKTVGNVKDATNFNAMEIQGYVTVVAGSTYRASVKVSVVKNGAGTYEVAATDIAGDDISGNPIVSFSMSGAMLQAQVSSSFGTVTNAEISFSVLNPSLNGEREASVDASAIVSGTIASDRLPLSTSADTTEQYLVPEYRETTITLVNSGPSNMNGTVRLTKVGSTVTVVFDGISHDSSGNAYVEGVVPAGYRPNVSDRVNAVIDLGGGSTSTVITEVQVWADGRISFLYRNYSGAIILRPGPTYSPVLTWLT